MLCERRLELSLGLVEREALLIDLRLGSEAARQQLFGALEVGAVLCDARSRRLDVGMGCSWCYLTT